eukprot:2377096-Lingulodinium_polyedra.AAC.1
MLAEVDLVLKALLNRMRSQGADRRQTGEFYAAALDMRPDCARRGNAAVPPVSQGNARAGA